MGLYFADQFVDLFSLGFDGLFAEDMLAGLGGGDRDRTMGAAGGTDADGMDVRILQQLVVVGKYLFDLVLCGELFSSGCVHIANSYDLRVGVHADCQSVLLGDDTGADNCKIDHVEHSFVRL